MHRFRALCVCFFLFFLESFKVCDVVYSWVFTCADASAVPDGDAALSHDGAVGPSVRADRNSRSRVGQGGLLAALLSLADDGGSKNR